MRRHTVAGELDRLAARFEAHCEGREAASFGSIMYRTLVVEPMRTVTPNSFDFGSVFDRQTRTVTLRNSGAVPVAVDRLVMSSTAFGIARDTCSGARLAAGVSCAIDVVAEPSDVAGSYAGYLEIIDNTSPTNTRGLRVALSATLAARQVFRTVSGRATRYSVPIVADLDGDGAQDVTWWTGVARAADPVWFSRGQGRS